MWFGPVGPVIFSPAMYGTLWYRVSWFGEVLCSWLGICGLVLCLVLRRRAWKAFYVVWFGVGDGLHGIVKLCPAKYSMVRCGTIGVRYRMVWRGPVWRRGECGVLHGLALRCNVRLRLPCFPVRPSMAMYGTVQSSLVLLGAADQSKARCGNRSFGVNPIKIGE